MYTLRLSSGLADLACMVLLLGGLAGLVHWRLAERAIIIPIAVLGTLNAVYIVLNRFARPDSMVGFFGMSGLLLSVAALYADPEPERRSSRLSARRFGLLLLAGFATGLSLATHLEAILLATFVVVTILMASSASWWQKLIACALVPTTFAAIWCGTLGRNSVAAWRQMQAINSFDGQPTPGILEEWSLLTRNFSIRDQGQYLLMFLEAMLLLCAIPLLAVWIRRREVSGNRAHLALALGVACLIDIFLVQFLLPDSPRRFGLILPGLLLCLAIVLPPLPLASQQLFAGVACVYGIATLIVLAIYFRTDAPHRVRFDPRRYDAIANYVAATLPPGGRIASSEYLWLAFQERGVPITLIFTPGFDGLSPFHDYRPDSLESFDTIVLLGSFKPDQAFLPQAMHNRRQTNYAVGQQIVEVFQRTGAQAGNH